MLILGVWLTGVYICGNRKCLGAYFLSADTHTLMDQPLRATQK